jgi:hypothetical protein
MTETRDRAAAAYMAQQQVVVDAHRALAHAKSYARRLKWRSPKGIAAIAEAEAAAEAARNKLDALRAVLHKAEERDTMQRLAKMGIAP